MVKIKTSLDSNEIMTGVITHFEKNYAKVCLSDDPINTDESCMLVGYLPKSLCSPNYWKKIAVGRRLELKSCHADRDAQFIIVAPTTWKNRYKRGLSVRGWNDVLNIDATERALITLSVKCPDCDAICFDKSIIELFSM